MSFDVAASAYRRFMGQYSEPLAHEFARFAEVRAGQRVLDVGCGPGALTAVLVQELGADSVCAIDLSPPFVEALRTAFPDVDVRAGAAEDLPWPDDAFDAAGHAAWRSRRGMCLGPLRRLRSHLDLLACGRRGRSET